MSLFPWFLQFAIFQLMTSVVSFISNVFPLLLAGRSSSRVCVCLCASAIYIYFSFWSSYSRRRIDINDICNQMKGLSIIFFRSSFVFPRTPSISWMKHRTAWSRLSDGWIFLCVFLLLLLLLLKVTTHLPSPRRSNDFWERESKRCTFQISINVNV